MTVLPTISSEGKTSPFGDFSSFLDSSAYGLLLTDPQGLPLYWNRGLLSLLGIENSTRVGKDRIASTLESKVRTPDLFEVRLRQIYSTQQDAKLRVSLKDNRTLGIYIQWQILSDGKQNCLWSVQDVSEEAKKIKYLEGVKRHYETAFCGSGDGVWDWNLKENLLYLSPRWESILLSEAKKQGGETRALHSLWDLCLCMPAEECATVEEKLHEHMCSSSPFFEVDFPIKADALRFLWVRMRGVSLRDEKKEVYRMSGLIMDITERKISEAGRELTGLHDRLTGLPNQSSFRKKLSQILKAKSKRKLEKEQGYTFSVLFIRLGRLSMINESFGPEYGDRVVQVISRRLQRLARHEDFLAMIEGNKFAMILKNSSEKEEIETFAKRVQKNLSLPLEVEEQTFVIEVRIGAIPPPPRYAKVRDILHECTKALAQARKESKDICILEEGIGLIEQEKKDFFLFNDLARKALQNKDFTLHFQPIVDLNQKRIGGCEALLRLKNAEIDKGEAHLDVPKLVNALEKSGQIVKLGSFVLREACRFGQELEDYGLGEDFEIKVNISPYELKQAGFCDRVEEILKSLPLKKCKICFEITENIFLDYNDELEAKLKQLKSIGFRLALDDFGTGYSSFSFLRDLPIDIVKLDHSFMSRALSSERDGALIASMLVMGHSLSLEVVAEGVETKEELEFLKGFECDHAQGFLFSPALSSQQFIDYTKAYNF